MNTNLFAANTPWAFWQCQPNPPNTIWQAAVQAAAPILDLAPSVDLSDMILEQTLGEGRFGPNHWTLNPSHRLYYFLKPILPNRLITLLKKLNSRVVRKSFPLNWPIEDRYVRFQWEVMRQVLIRTGQKEISYHRFWPNDSQFCLVLTHDIENREGQRFVNQLAEVEENMGFRSSFNFVPERYPLDKGLIASLQARGFEVGIHGLKHDGKLFNSKKIFDQQAERINQHLRSLQAVGFRTPLMHRNPEWMQALEIEYDLSFFDTDPYEPMPGGSMSLWPFIIGRFVELPYTLVQDSTLAFTLGETTPKVWLDKLDFIRSYRGMALLNSHPDYLLKPAVLRMYQSFLAEVKQMGNYWNPLACQAARWWRLRLMNQTSPDLPSHSQGTIVLENDCIHLR